MRKDKDEQRGLIACLGQVGDGHDVLRQLDPRQILDVLVLLVDDLRQLALGAILQLDRLLVHPHGHLRFDVRQTGAVPSDEGGDGRTPVAAADDADAIVLLGRVLGVGVEEDFFVRVAHFDGIGIGFCNYYVLVFWFVGNMIVVAFDEWQRYAASSAAIGRRCKWNEMCDRKERSDKSVNGGNLCGFGCWIGLQLAEKMTGNLREATHSP